MSDFKAKMHQICFPLGLCPTPLEELTALTQTQCSPRPLAVFEGSTSNGRESGEKGKGKVKAREWDTRWKQFWHSPYAVVTARGMLCKTPIWF